MLSRPVALAGIHPRTSLAILGILALSACAHPQAGVSPPPASSTAQLHATPADARPQTADPAPVLPPREAFARGWMPLQSTGVVDYLRAHPTYDGRGVLIGILDSGIDAGIAGLGTTTTGQRKILDLRDFSGEGRVPLTRISPRGDSVVVDGRTLRGFSRVRTLNAAGPWYAGVIHELPLGDPPASDLNGNGENHDALALIVTRAPDGWVVYNDADGDGSLSNDRPVHDFLAAKETFGWFQPGKFSPITVAANLREEGGQPQLDLFLDNSAHGSHVSGIAAGHDLYGVAGFDGVAPGAQLLGLKIANNAQGGLSVTGSMLRAMDYAITFAAQRRMPLVLNMSFGVGNEAEGTARIDQLIDSVLAAHPDVVFTISAGNDGPGLSTMGFPGSATRPITVGATFPTVFLSLASATSGPIAYFSSRGGELAKPDIVTPGIAYSTVPRWNVGDEQKGGTSMASPHAAGLAALLLSGLAQAGAPVEARLVKQALMVTARPLAGETIIDDGTGLPDVGAALRWLEGKHRVPEVYSKARGHGVTAAFRPNGLESPADTLQAFLLDRPAAAEAETFSLRSDAAWLLAPTSVTLQGARDSVVLHYKADAVRRPGVYTATVSGWTTDTLAGPAFRLVNTVVVPLTGGEPLSAGPATIPPGGEFRTFFRAQAGRPFAVETATGSASQQAFAYLFEPGGQPYREDNGISAGAGDEAAVYEVDGRDALDGLYEAVAGASPVSAATVSLGISQSPFVLDARTDHDGTLITLQNRTAESQPTEPFLALVGGERTTTIVAQGGDEQQVTFVVPDWAVHAVIDVSMDRAQWTRFTDFGLTLFDSVGRQLGKSPLNYAFGRLHVDLPRKGAFPASVGLFPGFAEPNSQERWTAAVSIRLYADSAHLERLSAPAVTVGPSATSVVNAPAVESPVPLGDGFVPLGIVVAPVGDRAWTREVPLPVAPPPLAQ